MGNFKTETKLDETKGKTINISCGVCARETNHKVLQSVRDL
jgi:hypothetical protein